MTKLDRGERFRFSRPPRLFWWVLASSLLAGAAMLLRMGIVDSRGGWLPDARQSIFYGAETAAWWARVIPLLLIVILVASGFSIWLYEHATGRRIHV